MTSRALGLVSGSVSLPGVEMSASHMDRRVLGRLSSILVACLLGCLGLGALGASGAEAAPQFDVSVSSPERVAPGGEQRRFTVSLVNSGTTATTGPVTLTASLPAGVTATAAADTSGFGVWTCVITDAGRTVTCTGPNFDVTIAPGFDACEGAGFDLPPCPIVIATNFAEDMPTGGSVESVVEACGGGAAECATESVLTKIRHFGDDFGIADVNVPGEQSVPAYPGTKAMWAGTCNRAAAPGFGEPIPGGFGTRPSTVQKPESSSGELGFDTVPAPAVVPHCIDWGVETTLADHDLFSTPPAWRLPAATEAGDHPDATSVFHYEKRDDMFSVDGSVDDIVFDLPAGFVADPNATPKCTAEQFAKYPVECPAETQVGVLTLHLVALAGNLDRLSTENHPVFNLEPRKGRVAELGVANLSSENATTARIVGKARTDGDFGVSAFVFQLPPALPLVAQQITLWGVPWASANDEWRTSGNGKFTIEGVPPGEREPYQPSWGPIRPFVSNPTECDGKEPVATLLTDSYQNQGAFTASGFPDLSDPDWVTVSSASPPVSGCERPPFDPAATLRPTVSTPDSPSGLDVDLTIPQNNDPPAAVATDPSDSAGAPAFWRSPAGRATAHLEKSVVTLPEGLTVNPSGAAGLEGCSDEQFGMVVGGPPARFNNEDPFDGQGAECPAGSRIGTVSVQTPLLDETLDGTVVLGTPKSTDPASGQMLRMFLVIESEERGLIAKIYGTAVADPQTGRLTATFEQNPRLPFEHLSLRLKGGDHGLLATPQECGAKTTRSVFSPWTAAHGGGGPVRDLSDGFAVAGDCSHGFGPQLSAGMSTSAARGNGNFSFKFTRNDGEQWVNGLTAQLPSGLLASVRDVPLCSSAQAAAGACPAGSRIGTVDAAAGAGTPFVLERKGSAYLTEGYKGCAYGLLVVVPVEAGPFRGPMALSDVVVRQRVCVDPTDAHVTAISDPLPTIHHGVPLRVRSVTVNVDRPGFMLNPSDCEAKEITAGFSSPQGATSMRAVAFQAAGCADLAFKPKLSLALTGRKQARTGKHPGVRAKVTQKGVGEAGIESAKVTLPKSLALDPDNAQALCEFADGTKPDLEDHCPKGSIVGRARAVSPLLKRPLAGNVYFVKNVRQSSSGNTIRTLPMIVVALRGEIAVNLKGESSTTKAGRLVNTFARVPDAPISRFNLNIKGGKRGILAVTRTRRSRIDICNGRQTAEADMDGHNGRVHDRNIRIKTPCKAKKKKQRKAGRAGKNRRDAGEGRRDRGRS
ncbi:MAG TPA: hypothetical protein VHF90_01920 [Thermoleophilaceae bacterium]|nr:hypothetical protein [Thermoleophilaceae bacterium]